MFHNSTITDLFLFVFTQLILHYQKDFVPFEKSNLKRFKNGMSVKVPPEIKLAQKKAHS